MARSFRSLLLVVLVGGTWSILLGADGCGGAVPIGTDECEVSRCGPALGLPTVTCADGSIGGSTGRCLASADGATCGWEVRECPPIACTDDRCGPPPPSLPGTQISCEAVATGTCEWVVTSDPTCDEAACGPAPGLPTYLCADGSTGGFTGRCITNADGTCGWEIIDCAPTGGDCALGECGPMPGSPAFVCPDGSIGGNTGRCLRDPATGTCGWEQRACPSTPRLCDGFAGVACAAGEVCIHAVGECGIADGQGACIVPPDVCTDEWAPVCGCDGTTYSNTCDAYARGVSIQHDGACTTTGTACGGFAGLPCAAGEYCNYPVGPDGMCGAADQLGVCERIPTACPDVVIPVCGCDGTTYGNDCEAAAAGVAVLHAGACP